MPEFFPGQGLEREDRETDPSPGQPKHDAEIDDAAPRLRALGDENHQNDDSQGQANRRDLGFLFGVEIAHRKEGREKRSQKGRAITQVANPGCGAGRETFLKSAIAFSDCHEQRPHHQHHDLKNGQRGRESFHRSRSQPPDGTSQEQGDTGESPEWRQKLHEDFEERGGGGAAIRQAGVPGTKEKT